MPASFRPLITLDGTDTRVLVEQITVVDPQRLGRAAGRLDAGELRAVDDALRLILELWSHHRTTHGNLWFVERNGNKVGRIDPHLLTLAPSGCVVPKLRGKTLTQAGVLLERAHCVTGRLSGRMRKRKPIVVSQHPAAKTVLPFDGKVNLRLGW
jgi:hypothetical protein